MQIKWISFFLVGVFFSTMAHANPPEFDHTHSAWNSVLKNFVVVKGASSQVRYKALKESPQILLQYLSQLESVNKTQFTSWSDSQKMAFWINAYNAYTLKLIIDHYPVKSIKDTGRFFSSPWKKEFFKLFNENFYLDKIEHEILRKQFQEPRIHFAVNCASIGCPALRAEAYTADKLNAQLQEQGQIFLQDSTRNWVQPDKKQVHLSPIFKWFKEDFGSQPSRVIEFVKPYMRGEIRSLDLSQYSLEYSDYDWSLNDIR